MKIATSFLAGVLVIGTLGVINTATAEEGTVEKVPRSGGNYCHELFPAIQPRTLGTDDPKLTSKSSGDVIDFYGPCNESPTGKDQQWEQQLEQEHRYFED